MWRKETGSIVEKKNTSEKGKRNRKNSASEILREWGREKGEERNERISEMRERGRAKFYEKQIGIRRGNTVTCPRWICIADGGSSPDRKSKCTRVNKQAWILEIELEGHLGYNIPKKCPGFFSHVWSLKGVANVSQKEVFHDKKRILFMMPSVLFLFTLLKRLLMKVWYTLKVPLVYTFFFPFYLYSIERL